MEANALPPPPVAPDTINNHVKTCREEKKSLHFFAPEYGGKSISVGSVGSDSNQLPLLSAVANVTTAVDIYSFGMCALEVSCSSVRGREIALTRRGVVLRSLFV